MTPLDSLNFFKIIDKFSIVHHLFFLLLQVL
nr:MAG TPA: hypothetical protein [Caudoviricetes sp.]